MPYLDHQPEDTWQKRLFDKLKNVEDKLDRLLVLREQEIDTTIRPPLKPEYLDIIDVSKILKVEQKPFTTGCGLGRFLISKLTDDCFSFGER